MMPPYPCDLILRDHRGVLYRVPGWVTKDHGPAFEYRLLVICPGYEDFGSAVNVAPGSMYCTWARLADVSMREAEAA